MEKQTIPMWEKLFKTLGIYDVDYHKKYRKYLRSERYMTYITLVTDDIYKKFRAANAARVGALVFSKPTFAIEWRNK